MYIADDLASNVFRHTAASVNKALKVVESPEKSKSNKGTFSNDSSIISPAFFHLLTTPICCSY